MTINKYYPPSIYHFLLNLAHENGGLSVKEVETVLLRKQIMLLGFKCDHHNIGFAKKNNKPYCKDCWTRLKQVSERAFNYETRKWVTNVEFLPLGTFLDTQTNLDNQEKNETIETEEAKKTDLESSENI